MRWLILGAALVAAALAVWILMSERRPGRARSSVRGVVVAGAVLVVIGAVAYAAHFAGFYSFPIVVVLFIPFGLAGRWLALASRGARDRREAAHPAPPPSLGQRFMNVAFWPLFVTLVVLVACLGLAAGILASHR